MFGANPSSSSLFANPTGVNLGASTGLASGSGFGNPGTLGTAGTLFSSTSLANTTAATRPGFTFGQPTATTTASTFFGGAGATPNPATTGFGTTGGGFALPTRPSTGFSFGVSTVAPTTTTTTLTGFGTLTQPGSTLFGVSTSSSAPSFGLGGFGNTVAPSLGFTAPSVPTQLFGGTNVSTTGLGGVGSTTTTLGKNDSKTLKEYPVPPEIGDLVESFKNHIKVQKAVREENSHVSAKYLDKVVDYTETLKQLLSVISNGLQRNIANIRNLKSDTVQELKNAEIVQRTKEIPFPLQYENSAPMEYFSQLIIDFEQRMKVYRQQIDALEKHLVLITETSSLTPQDLLQTIRKLHDAFISIAAQLQVVHESVQMMRERFVQLDIKVGENLEQGQSGPVIWSKSGSVPVSVGPSPFGVSHSSIATAFATAYERAQQITGAPTSMNLASNYQGSLLGTTGFGSSLQSRPLSNAAPLGLATSSGLALKPLGPNVSSSVSLPTTPVFGVSNQSAFQLQKPPIGNKRGKR